MILVRGLGEDIFAILAAKTLLMLKVVALGIAVFGSSRSIGNSTIPYDLKRER